MGLLLRACLHGLGKSSYAILTYRSPESQRAFGTPPLPLFIVYGKLYAASSIFGRTMFPHWSANLERYELLCVCCSDLAQSAHQWNLRPRFWHANRPKRSYIYSRLCITNSVLSVRLYASPAHRVLLPILRPCSYHLLFVRYDTDYKRTQDSKAGINRRTCRTCVIRLFHRARALISASHPGSVKGSTH